MPQENIQSLLRIDSSAATSDSLTRQLGDEVMQRLQRDNPAMTVKHRDLANGLDFIDEQWVTANLTDPPERTGEQQARLAGSDELVAELAAADALLLTVPVYNFSVPAVLKAWIDQVCRAGLTFSYTDKGPVGLLTDRPVYLVMASGGTAFGSPADFATQYLAHIFSFIGITDIRPVYAERTAMDSKASEQQALGMLEQWLPAMRAA